MNPLPLKYNLIASDSGKIMEIVISFNFPISTVREKAQKDLEPWIEDFYKNFDDDVVFWILCTPDIKTNVGQYYRHYRSGTKVNMVYCDISINDVMVDSKINLPELIHPPKFIQDWFHVAQTNNETILVKQVYPPHTKPSGFSEMFAADEISIHRKATFIKSTITKIDGGNVLCIKEGQDYIMLLPESVTEKNIGSIIPDKKVLEERIKSDFGVDKIIWLNNKKILENAIGHDTLYHLDMYLTPAGKSDAGIQILLVARLKPMPREIDICDEDDFNKLQTALDGLAATLRSMGFFIIRMPLLYMHYQDAVYTYNNCICEAFNGIKRLYLPSYIDKYPIVKKRGGVDNSPTTLSTENIHDGSKAVLDFRQLIRHIEHNIKRNLELKYGYQVRFISGEFSSGFIPFSGSLHCMSKVIRREY